MKRNDQLQQLNEHVNIGPVDSIVNSFTDYIYATAVLINGKNIILIQNRKTPILPQINVLIKIARKQEMNSNTLEMSS